jgi:8-oxo-dGTP pyrophosphatase MutT (NUDIX family)
LRAAGGLLWQDERRRRLAIVKRSRHGGGWSLPKGKLERAEDWEAAAAREVQEETGYRPLVLEHAGTLRYDAGGQPKEVRFWHMQVAGPAGERDAEEVEECRFVDPWTALWRVRHREQRRLLLRWLLRSGWGVRRVRQRRAREAAEELEQTLGSGASPRDLLAASRKAADRGDLGMAWSSLHAAERLSLRGLSYPELYARRVCLREEAREKLRDWRKEAALMLLEPALWPEPAIAGAASATDTALRDRVAPLLERAQQLMHERAGNVYHKADLRRAQVGWAVLLLVAATAVAGVAYVRGALGLPDAGAARFLSWAALGFLGGSFSGVLSLLGRNYAGRIPEELADGLVVFARFAVGACSGAIAGLLAALGVLPLVDGGAHAPLAIAFLAGFSERVILRAVSK